MSLSIEQQQLKIEWYKKKLRQSDLARTEQRAELTELYEYCAIIEDVLCSQSKRYLQ